MSKNNDKTMNVRTHNSFELYKNPTNNPDEEFAEEFVAISKNKVTNEINKKKSNKRKQK
ncbi:hypothetical protein C7437_101663 [Psychrobacillus insolitus]|uniref:Uncharacterized protein n=1 Tax=Psychrobacillus insolitus TaxID=1461 RepID=A0A2W7ML05_9BACI|nr:hypothetical protein [Psychrobacillus insolitus]PZX07545.1 hypothetical protein C7437_101663 [Psychrobacillus insolitus]